MTDVFPPPANETRGNASVRPVESNHSLKERPVILSFASYYLPGYKAGGPIRTLENLVENFSDEFDFC